MINATGDIDDFKTLQREAEELLASRKRAGLDDQKQSGTMKQHEGGESSSQPGEDVKEAVQTERSIHDFAEQIDVYLEEIEEAALERPLLALLAAFSIGIVVGKLFSRR